MNLLWWSVWIGSMMRLLLAILLLPLLLKADQTVTLAWDPNPEPDVNAYVVYYGLGSRVYSSSTNVGNVTTATVYSLQEGKTYYFAITARNTSGLESDFSNEVTNAIPESVTNLVPSIDSITNKLVYGDGAELVFPVRIWDVETDPRSLQVTGTSTNKTLLANGNIIVQDGWESTNGWERVVKLRLSPGVFGQTLVTLVVSDGTKAASTSFLVVVTEQVNPPRRVVFVSNLQSAPTRNGPWTNVLTTILPVHIMGDTQRFYRTWIEVQR